MSTAVVTKIKKWSPMWIVPLITVIIGAILVVSHFKNQGYSFTLTTQNADWISAGKTVIKSRSVDVGLVMSVELSPDYDHVILHCVMNKKMKSLLKKDSVFWVVSPQIDRTGISGLTTILSGAYIEVKPGRGDDVDGTPSYSLMDTAPPASWDEPGLRLTLKSSDTYLLSVGTPVEFRGYIVGRVERAEFDLDNRSMRYNVFIQKPYDVLVTKNVRFWKTGGIDLTVSARGFEVNFPSLDTLLAGGISFDTPQGFAPGAPAKPRDEYVLYRNQNSIQEFQFTKNKEYMLFFDSSVSGLEAGAPVEFRGIRIGSVLEVPYIPDKIDSFERLAHNIPVLIRIEPERMVRDPNYDTTEIDKFLLSKDVRASLRTSSLLTGMLYVDLDLLGNTVGNKPKETYGYDVIATVPGGLTRLQNEIFDLLDRFEKLPVEPMLVEATKSFEQIHTLLAALDAYMKKNEMQQLPQDIRKSLDELNTTLQGFQEGSALYDGVVGDLEYIDKVMRELQPVLKTLNEKSNSLFFEAQKKADVEPKAGKK